MTDERDEDKFLEQLANAILDGTRAPGEADGEVDAEQRAALRQAEIIARIADVHQHLQADDTALNGRVDPGSTPLSWGRLTILDELGRGAFGAVYRARDPRLDRDVALKLLWPGGADPERFMASMVEEGRLLARIHHPNVVTIHDANVIDGRVGLTMEFVRGQTLSHEFQARGPFTPEDATGVGVEIAHALAAVHEAGLLHRDVKAQNVMRRTDGRLVLMDFGAGRRVDGGAGEGAAITGTPLYLAPEVLGGHRATVQSDLYSLGVLLFYLLTGNYPVTGQTIRELREAHRSGRRKLLAESRPDVPAALSSAIERALAAAPSDRWASAGDMAAALASIQGQARPIWKPGVIAWLVLVLAVVAMATFVLTRQGRPDDESLTIRRITVPDLFLFGSLSRDGRYLPYGASDGSRLMLRDLRTGQDRTLAESTRKSPAVFWSAVVSRDGRQIAYFLETEEARELRVLDVRSGSDRILLRDETPGGAVNGATLDPVDWMPDGSAILAFRSRTGESHDIVLVGTSDGTVRTLKSGLPWLVTMSLSNDGRFVTFDYPNRAAGDARDITLLDIATATERSLVTDPAQDTLPVWMPQDAGVMFTSDRSGTFGLWMVPIRDGRPAGETRLIRKDIGLIGSMSLANDGTLFYDLSSGEVDVHTARLNADVSIVPGSSVKAAPTYQGSNMDPEWSPDSKSLAYVSRRRAMGPHAIALVIRSSSLDDRAERLLWPDLQGFSEPRWSRDGTRFIVRGNDTRGRRGPWLLDASSGQVLDRLSGPPFPDMEWARDGRSLFVIAQNRVGRFDLASKSIRDIYRDSRGRSLAGLAVSPDERWLAITLIEKNNVFSIDVIPAAGGAAREVLSTTKPDVFMLQEWTRDGTEILFSRGNAGDSDYIRGDWTVWSVPAAGGQPHSLGLTGPRLRGVKVSPDGLHLAYRLGDPGSDHWIMRNFLP